METLDQTALGSVRLPSLMGITLEDAARCEEPRIVGTFQRGAEGHQHPRRPELPTQG